MSSQQSRERRQEKIDETFAREFPEHQKLKGRREEQQAIESFMAFMEGQGMLVARYRTDEEKAEILKRIDDEVESGERSEEDARIDRHEWKSIFENPMQLKPEKVIAEYFDVDLRAFSKEKDKMLDAIRCRDLVS